jgi:hypothetical protein
MRYEALRARWARSRPTQLQKPSSACDALASVLARLQGALPGGGVDEAHQDTRNFVQPNKIGRAENLPAVNLAVGTTSTLAQAAGNT